VRLGINAGLTNFFAVLFLAEIRHGISSTSLLAHDFRHVLAVLFAVIGGWSALFKRRRLAGVHVLFMLTHGSLRTHRAHFFHGNS